MNFASKGQKTPDRVHWDIYSLVSNHNTTCVCQQQAMIPNSEHKELKPLIVTQQCILYLLQSDLGGVNYGRFATQHLHW